ncbi:MAG: anti-sigma regulatory factor [Bacteroidales bacterium]|nr:anti-sigma regulatory factor [Bacteroidales bacterium]MCF8327505.1 anti-sigma regulatory factor [Bacteroidales bacterium]
MNIKFDIEGGNFSSAGLASSEVKRLLKQLNIDIKTIKRLVVAMYEAEVNIVAHAYQGEADVEINEDHIKVVFTDHGPGIDDIDLAMQKGYSTASEQVREMGFGAGMGLPNIKSHADKLNITSEVGKGTRVEIICYLNA